jgi:hypothetical protein
MSFTKAVWICLILGVAFLTAHGQDPSLGDVARAQKQKAAASKTAPARVITNEEIPESAQASEAGDSAQPAHHHASASGQKTAQQWKSEIQAQKDQVASLQRRIDQENSSIHFVEANRYYYGVQHNERQVRKQEDVERLQNQLEEQKKALEDMQEGARQQGFGNSVYEP